MSYELNTPVQTHTVYLDSLNCVQRLPVFKYGLSTPIRAPTGITMLLTVENITFPNTFFNIVEGRNKISYKWDRDFQNGVMLPVTQTVTYEPGLYNVYQFADAFNANTSIYVGANQLVMTVDKVSCRLTIASQYLSEIINTVSHPTTVGDMVGVGRNGDNEFNFPIVSGLSPTYTIRFPRGFNFTGGQYVFLNMPGITLNNINSFGDINDCLIRVPINAAHGYICNYRPTDNIRFIVQRSEITELEFDLTNQHGEIVYPDNLEIVLRIDFFVAPNTAVAGEGSIDYYYRENPVPQIEEQPEEDDGQLG